MPRGIEWSKLFLRELVNSDLSVRCTVVFVIARSEYPQGARHIRKARFSPTAVQATWQSRVGSTVFEIATAASGLAMT